MPFQPILPLVKFEDISRRLRDEGIRARVISASHFDQVKDDIISIYRSGLLDDELYRDYISDTLRDLPPEIADARSIIVTSSPQPRLEVLFRWREKTVNAIVPPTYARGEEVLLRIERMLTELARPEKYRFARARIPLKTLAARSGLGAYGRNNIIYVDGMGSYHRLSAFISDWPSDEDHWQERQLARKCEKCTACLNACPTGAVSNDRVLLRAHRCLTFHNEKDGKFPFPSWIQPSWHNALVGCMICQGICPMNRINTRNAERILEFSEEETDYLLKGEFGKAPGSEIEGKLKRAGLDLSVFPRNLAAILQSDGGG